MHHPDGRGGEFLGQSLHPCLYVRGPHRRQWTVAQMRVRVPAPHRLDVIKRADFDAAGECVAADLVRNKPWDGRAEDERQPISRICSPPARLCVNA